MEVRFSLAPSLSLWLVLRCREAVIIESTVAEEHGRAEHLLAWEDIALRDIPLRACFWVDTSTAMH